MRHLLLSALFIFPAGWLYTQSNLNYIRQIDSLGNIKKVTLQASTLDEPENVLVLYNINYHEDANNNNIWDGYEIAQYYKAKRNIPDENIAAIRTSTNMEISRAEYDTYYDDGSNVGIKQQVEEILQRQTDADGLPLRSKIKYIVLTKGIPHKIKYLNSNKYFEADYASVDASLALIFNGDYDISWHYENPYYRQDPEFEGLAPFIPEFYELPGSLRLSFLVSRLDGYTVEDVKAMIDRAYKADITSRDKTFLLDGDKKAYDHMENAAFILNSMDAKVYPDPWIDETEDILTLQDSVVAIVTHGVHAGLPSTYITDLYDFKLKDGAVFSSYESINGSSMLETVHAGQGQIADFIHIGGSGGVGNVYEPYVSNISNESILLPAYYSGYTFVEAAYMSLARIDWTAIVIGDPLMRIGPKPQPVSHAEYRVISIKPNILAFNQSRFAMARVVFSEVIDSLRLPNFIVQQTGDTLNSYVYRQSLYLWPRQPLPTGVQIKYTADAPLYDVNGDSITLAYHAWFVTAPADGEVVAPYVYDAYPAGTDIDINDDLFFIFSTAMKPETIFPILSEPLVGQNHQWTDSTILRVKHAPFKQGTRYSFFLDEHAKSVDNIGLMQNFHLTFETGFNSIVYDIDKDGFQEYALNLNNSLLDGYEVYADSNGLPSSIYAVSDMNNDNQNEFFIKLQQNEFPSYLWNPNAIPFTGYVTACSIVDDDEDGQKEYAFDSNGTGYFTHVYDPGEANPVRPINFVLLSSVPDNGQNNVIPGNTLKLTFSTPPLLNELADNILTDFANNISGIYTAKNGTEINIQFMNNFPADSSISITVKQNISSVDGSFLSHDYQIRFHTRAAQTSLPPRVTSFYPGDSLKISDNTPTVRFVFSKPMQTDVNDPVIVDTTTAALWTHYWADNNILYLLPVQQLKGNTNYIFTLSDDLTDLLGQHISGKTRFNFTSNESELDNNKPTVLQIVPEPGHAINSTQKIRIIFSEWIASQPQQWINILPQQVSSWNSIGSNLFTFSGDPGWHPQSELQLLIDGGQLKDANLNNALTGYILDFYVLGDIIENDIDQDGIMEYVTDNNNDLNDGLELYVDPGGIITQSIFEGDIDGDGFYDFIIADSTENILTAWYPAVKDSGLTTYCEKLSTHKYDVSVDTDNLVEYTVDIIALSVKAAVPRIRSVLPADGANSVEPYSPLIIQFNTAMDAFSVVQSVQFSLFHAGNWTNSYMGSQLKYEPLNGWQPGIVQTITVVPLYRALNQQTGSDTLIFSFRTAEGEQNQPGNLSWQFPAEHDTVHPMADYYFAFTQAVDTSTQPAFVILQNTNSINCDPVWLNDTLLKVQVPPVATGDARLVSSGMVKFLSSEPINFNNTTHYTITDNPGLHLVRPLFNEQASLPLSAQLLLLFNQPLDSVFSTQISFAKIENNNLLPEDVSYIPDRNLLSITPVKLQYASQYQLKLSENLKGISGNNLADQRIFLLHTEEPFIPSTYEIDWRQAEDFLILNWPLAESHVNRFELFLSEKFIADPDTLSQQYLYGTTDVPSWLFNLRYLAEHSYIYIRLRHGNDQYWSRPLYINSGFYKAQDLISLALLQNSTADSLKQHQEYLHTLSQWLNKKDGWNSVTYLDDIQQWNSNILFLGNKGIMGRPRKAGYIAWLQNLPQVLAISETEEQQVNYRSLLNPYEDVWAGDLAQEYGRGTRLAIWDNRQQGWNEAVYDTANGVWINNFQLHLLQPVYVYSGEAIDTLVSFEKYSNSDNMTFPSQTIIFNKGIYRMQIYKNGLEIKHIVGCGLDSVIHAAYVNIANLDKRHKWLFKFYSKDAQPVGEYSYGSWETENGIQPLTFKINHPYPNPFNYEVTIPMAIPEKGHVDIKIFNVLGQLVYADHKEINNPQYYNYKWSGSKASGVYLVQCVYKNKTAFTKVIMIK